MIENKIKNWVEEQLSLGEEPEILRQTLLELDIDEKDVMTILPENIKKQKEVPITHKQENKKTIDTLLPKESVFSKIKKILPKKSTNSMPVAPKPKQITVPSELKTTIPKEQTKKTNEPTQKMNMPKPQEKKIGPAKLKMLPAPNKRSLIQIIKTKPIFVGLIFILILYFASLALSNYVETRALELI